MQEKTLQSIFQATKKIEAEVGKVIIGKEDVIHKVLMAILANGHILLDDVPGVGKTSLAVALGKTLGLEYNRIQCTPDTTPADITGFSMYDPVSKQYWRYGPSHLGENTELTEAEAALDPLTGKITVATSDGFISFQPDRLKENAFVPPLAFVGVLFHGDPKMSQMPPDYNLDVPSDRRNLTIYFAALDYQDNYMVHYSYKLEGVDKEWNQIGTEHSISFNHLPHGHHQLFVRSTNSYGKWVDNTRILHIYVHPTFWETWWAKLLYALLFILVLGVAVWIYRLRTVNSMERRLNEMKTQFFTDVSHKLRTPLTLIGGPVTQVLSTEKLGDNGRKG